MKKKILSFLLIVILAIVMSVSSFTATDTLEDTINKMTLSPAKTKNWPQEYKDMILDGLDSKTNYQKMKAIYNDFASASWNQINCVGYAVAL